MRRTLTVILASDVAGYSRLVADREEETIERFRQAATVFTDLVKKYQGTVFNTAGDAILAQFDSAVDATRCALDIQDANNANNVHIAEQQKLLFRIGIAIGDVLVAENGDLLGDAVNVAARLESLAEPGGICISDEVRSHVLNKIRLNVVDLGDQTLRNIPRAIRAFKLVAGIVGEGAPRGRVPPDGRRRPSLRWYCGLAVSGSPRLACPWSPHAFDGSRSVPGRAVRSVKVPLVTDRVRGKPRQLRARGGFQGDRDLARRMGRRAARRRRRKRQARGARSLHAARPKGFCRIYAVGNKVVAVPIKLPLPAPHPHRAARHPILARVVGARAGSEPAGRSPGGIPATQEAQGVCDQCQRLLDGGRICHPHGSRAAGGRAWLRTISRRPACWYRPTTS